MDVLIALVIFIGILLLVVLIHEAGHFFAARISDVKVEEFGFGFPPKLFGWRPEEGETEYTINALPLGGFVRLHGEDGSYAEDPRSFAAQKYPVKAFILTAGVFMNLILAIILFWIMGLLGAPVTVTENTDTSTLTQRHILISQVVEGSPAAQADLERGARVVSLNGEEVTYIDDLQSRVQEEVGNVISLTVQQGSETKSVTLTPRENPPEGEGAIGIGMVERGVQQFGVVESAQQAVTRTVGIIVATAIGLYQLAESVVVEKANEPQAELAGPVGIFSIVQQMYQQGISYVLSIAGVISTSLAFFNILPIPALDGGRLAVLSVERVRGKAFPQERVEQVQGFGMLVLLALIIAVTIKDIIDLL